MANNEFSKFLNQFPTKQFSENDVLLIPGKNPTSLFYLARGHIRLFSTSEQGKELTLHIFEKDSIFPLSWALNNTNQEYGLQAIAKTKVTLVPKEKFVAFLRQHPTVLYKYIQNLAKGIDGLTKRIEIVSMDNAQNRVKSALVYLSKHFSSNKDDNEVHVRFPRKKSKNLLAQASVVFAGVIETHGWTISKSEHIHPQFQEPIWIQPPRARAGIYWKRTVWANDKKLWKQIEEKIYDRFHKVRISYENKETDKNTELDS